MEMQDEATDQGISKVSSDITSMDTDIPEQQFMCEPCSTRSQEEVATSYCKECDEKYCDNCTSSHKTQKATKKHTVVDVKLAVCSVPRKKCEPCGYKNRDTEATCVCEECEEFLCDQCKTFHLSQKRNKDHKIISISVEVLCEPCRNADKKEQATAYCLDCDDPEAMCPSCAEQHNAMKQTRDHTLSHDLATYILKHKSREAPNEIQDCSEMCEPCQFNNRRKPAIVLCEECKEHLCEECKKTHQSLKISRNHPLTSLTTSLSCANCSVPGNDVKATFYCEDCADLICDVCAENHKAMKITRKHNLSTDLSRSILKSKRDNASFKEEDKQALHDQADMGARPKVFPHYTGAQTLIERQVGEICEPCSYNSKTVCATYLCVECEEHLCEECLKYHKALVENREHRIQNISKIVLFCSTCQSLGKKMEATSYCVDCKEPQPLCDNCVHRHLSMKKTRSHNFSSDFSNLPTRFRDESTEQKPNEKVDQVMQKVNGIQLEDNDEDDLGQPYSTESKSNSVMLQWRTEHRLLENESYQIMFKEEPNGKWKPYIMKEACSKSLITIYGLKAATSYVFKVRIVNDSTGEEGKFSPQSEVIDTKPSPALGILQKAELIDRGPPEVYRLPIRENVTARNDAAKTRKFSLGKPGNDVIERTIMIVGATGSGKSTLINGMANYIMGVSFEDPFRFTLINLETCEREREGNQAHSQTEWVTCYTIHNNVSDRVNYTINLIDTPGFGDTRGLEQDAKIVEQIRQLFTAKGEQGVATLDAVCFILKAPDARLTTTQKYIFESILALFGNDIEKNICTLITFADGQRPPVLAGIEALDGIPLPHEIYFTFNNSALFVDNKNNTSNNLSSFFWDMGIKSCSTFFEHLTTLQTRSLTLTAEVLRNRQKLENTVVHLQEEIEVGLSKINVLEEEVRLFSQNARAILENKDFEYVVEEAYQEKIDLSGKSQYTTNCLACNYTCHENCVLANDSDKARCCAMNTEGKCNQCPKGCHWTQHHNTPYIIKWTKRKVKKRYDEMKKKYEEATQKSLTQEQVLEEMSQDITRQEQAIQVMMEVISKLNNRLKEIALRPDPLSTAQYIDLMIASEKREQKSGFEARIDALQKCKQRTTYNESVKIFKSRVGNTRQTIAQTFAASEVADEILKDDNKSVMGWIKNLFGLKK